MSFLFCTFPSQPPHISWDVFEGCGLVDDYGQKVGGDHCHGYRYEMETDKLEAIEEERAQISKKVPCSLVTQVCVL